MKLFFLPVVLLTTRSVLSFRSSSRLLLSSVAPGPPVPDPVNGTFHPDVLKDLKELAQFNVHVVIGLPDNEVIPSLSYSDFLVLKNCCALNWVAIEAKIGNKYVALRK